MDFERLERAWRASANSPDQAAGIYLTEKIMDTLKQRRKAFDGFTTLIGIVLAAWMAKIAYDVIYTPFPFDLAREWGAIVLLAFPWGALWIVRRQYRRHLDTYPDPYSSTAATLRALIDENAVAQRRTRVMALVSLAFVAAIALMLSQLQAVGKMSADNVLQGSILFGVILGGIWLYYALNYFRTLKPEGERLERLLADYSTVD